MLGGVSVLLQLTSMYVRGSSRVANLNRMPFLLDSGVEVFVADSEEATALHLGKIGFSIS